MSKGLKSENYRNKNQTLSRSSVRRSSVTLNSEPDTLKMTSSTTYYSRPSGSSYTSSRHATSRYNYCSDLSPTSGSTSGSSLLSTSRFYNAGSGSNNDISVSNTGSLLRKRSTYDLNSKSTNNTSSSGYQRLPPSSASSSLSMSLSPKSYTSSYLSSRYSNGTSSSSSSGYSSSSSSSSTPVTLTRYHRRTSFDYHNDSSDTQSIGSSSIGSSSISSKISTSGSSSSVSVATRSPVAGLTNLGNTCYMNSVIQALYATKQLRDFIVSGLASGSLYTALSRLFKDMSSSIRSGYSNPSCFRSSFIQYENKFRGYDQQDAQEFLRYLINGLAEEVNKAKTRPKRSMIEPKSSQEAWNQYRERVDDSKLMEIFVGQFSSVIKCCDCSNESTCWDPFWDLSLAVPRYRSRVDVEECLKDFTDPETLDGSEQPFCSQCKKHRRSTKRLSIVRTPKILIIHLKKFSNDGYKLSADIAINQQLTINSVDYSIYACVCHHGYSSRSGHYTAYCQYDDRWFHLNDESVSDVTEHFNMSTLKDAYVLFYRQKCDSSSYSSSSSSSSSCSSSRNSSSSHSSAYSSRL